MEIPTESARWRRSQIAETFASVRVSAPSYRFAEYVGFVPVVEPELKLVQVQRQIFLADVMVRSDDAALEQRPERFNRVRVDIATDVLASRVPDKLVLAIVDVDGVVCAELIRYNQRRMSLGYLPNEASQRVRVRALDYLADHVTLASDCTNDCDFAGRRTARPLDAILAMAILVQAADKGLVHFDDPHQLAKLRVFHSSAQTHAHIPRGLVRAGSEHAMDLECADSLLARDHQVQNLEPHDERLLRFLEDGSGSERKTIGRARLRAALHTLPVPRTRRTLVHVIVLATRTLRAGGPTSQEQISAACVLIREERIEVAERHLSHKTRLVLVVSRHARDISEDLRVSQEPDNPLLQFRGKENEYRHRQKNQRRCEYESRAHASRLRERRGRPVRVRRWIAG